MQDRNRCVVLAVVVALTLAFAGCGGGSEFAPSNSPAPAPSYSAPPPAGGTGSGGNTGGGSGGGTGGGTGASSSSADFYFASLFRVADTGLDSPETVSTVHHWTIKVNEAAADGRGVLQLTGADPNGTYQLRFCYRGAPRAFTNCISLLDYSTDVSGSATLNFQMPRGNYSGVFYVFKGADVRFAAGVNSALTGTSFSAGLSPGVGTPGRGRAEFTGRMAKVAITAGPPNETFRCQLLNITRGGSDLGIVATDAQGNGTNDPALFATNPAHPAGWTGTIYCSAKCQTGICQFTYGSSFSAP